MTQSLWLNRDHSNVIEKQINMQRGRSVLKESDIEVHFFVRGKLRVRLRQCGFSASGLLSDCGRLGSVSVACCQTAAVWVQCQWPAVRLRQCGFSDSGLLSDWSSLPSVPVACSVDD